MKPARNPAGARRRLILSSLIAVALLAAPRPLALAHGFSKDKFAVTVGAGINNPGRYLRAEFNHRESNVPYFARTAGSRAREETRGRPARQWTASRPT